MNIFDELDLSNPKKFREYAVNYSGDELLDALNLCEPNSQKQKAIIKILDIQNDLSEALDLGFSDDLNLKILLDKFYANPDHYSLRYRLLDAGAKDPELSFKALLLKALTLILDGEDLSEDLEDLFEEFKIDVNDSHLLHRLRLELELDLNAIYSKKVDGFCAVSTDSLMHDSLENMGNCMNEYRERRFAHGRLEGKDIIPGHCAFNDGPDGLMLYGENVVKYVSGDEYIPCDNHANSLELLEKIYNCSIEELEQLYAEGDNDLSFWKHFFKNNINGYRLYLLRQLSVEMIDLIGMYERGDRFIVAKGTYRGKEVFDGKLISCRYVDIYSQNTGKIYRALSV